MTAPQRELTQEEVLSIFEHVHHNSSLPPCLQYQVIPVDPNGSKISPPRFNFTDGLFVLCDIHHPNLPKHLLEMKCRELPPTSKFHWHPAKRDLRKGARIQLRDAYRYSGHNGGNIGGPKAYLWTKLVEGGDKEDLQYRLVHVLAGKFTAPKKTATSNVSKDSKKDYVPKRLKTKSSTASIPVARLPVQSHRPESTPAVKPTSSKTPTVCLNEEQVKAVFDSVYNNTKAPPHLQYQIIPIDEKGRISPPRLKYNDGIYILCDMSDATLPSHLQALVATSLPPTKNKLRWNASGMATSKVSQYSRRHVSAMNDRNERFADYNKNATMWSHVVDGKEDLKCRIFHVFPHATIVSVKKQGSAKQVTSSRKVSRKANDEDGCQVCGKQDHCDSLMECDGCASRYCHTFCLGLTALPESDWFCKTCMPRGKPPKKRAAPNGGHYGAGSKKSRSSTVTRTVSPVPMDTLMEEETEKPIHYKIMSRQTPSGNADRHIGFLAVKAQQSDATFTDIRAMIHEELDPESLPKGSWKFVVPTLGPIGNRQESSIGPVARLYKRAFEGQDGSGWNPFELSLMTSPQNSS